MLLNLKQTQFISLQGLGWLGLLRFTVLQVKTLPNSIKVTSTLSAPKKPWPLLHMNFFLHYLRWYLWIPVEKIFWEQRKEYHVDMGQQTCFGSVLLPRSEITFPFECTPNFCFFISKQILNPFPAMILIYYIWDCIQ